MRPTKRPRFPLERLVPERLRAWHREGVQRYARTGMGPLVDGVDRPVELPALRMDGTEFCIELTLTALSDIPFEGRYVMAIIRDVTERRRVEEELRQTIVQMWGRSQPEDPPRL